MIFVSSNINRSGDEIYIQSRVQCVIKEEYRDDAKEILTSELIALIMAVEDKDKEIMNRVLEQVIKNLGGNIND